MARSLRRHPISGNCLAASDKYFKRQAASRLRVAVRTALRSGRHEILPQAREIASQRASRKDGRGWVGNLPPAQLAALMRK